MALSQTNLQLQSTSARSTSSISHSQTQVISSETENIQESGPPILRLRLQKPKNYKKVAWRQDTIDNEHMGKKKSKCCCIYKKPTVFGESSSESEGECEHCFGHTEIRKTKNKKPDDHEHQLNPREAT